MYTFPKNIAHHKISETLAYSARVYMGEKHLERKRTRVKRCSGEPNGHEKMNAPRRIAMPNVLFLITGHLPVKFENNANDTSVYVCVCVC